MRQKNIPIRERIIFALDVATPVQAQEWVQRLESHIGFFKVGLELFLAGGFPMIEWIAGRGHKVIADLKFFDIPETVRRAVFQLRNHGITFATVHGYDSILRAAAQDKGGLKILAVTVLTSLGEEDMQEMGFSKPIGEVVLDRATRAIAAGCDGVVASGLEAARLRRLLGDAPLIVTPGIRPGGGNRNDDQKRTLSAAEAIANGADHLVIGRPIREAQDPIAVVTALQEEIGQP